MTSSRPRPPADRRNVPPRVIGLLGGIASGKSLVGRLLAGDTGVVLDADRHAREVLAEPEVASRIERELGPGLLDPGGRPDRAAIGRLVFADPEARRKLEGWIHPRVRDRMRVDLAEALASGRTPIVLDVPLLLENDAQHGLVAECDLLVFVDSDPGEREHRAARTRGWELGEVARREAAQMPLSQKRALADRVVSNTGSLEDLAREVATVLSPRGPTP